MSTFNIAIQVKAKHGYIYQYMIEHKINASELARQVGTDPSKIGQIINFQWIPPKRAKGGLIDKLESFFKIPIDMLFPPELTEEIAKRLGKKQVIFKEVTLLQLQEAPSKALVYDPEENQEEEFQSRELTKSLATLRPREETCLRLLFGISNEQEINIPMVNKKP